jgi:hypothetical protein
MEETLGGSNALGVVQFHAFRLHELEQPFAVSAYVPLHFRQRGEFLAFGLAYLVICGRASARSMESPSRYSSR